MLCVDTDNRIGAVPAVIEDIATDNGFEKSEQLESLGIVSCAGANMTAPDAYRRRTRRERGSCRWLAADEKNGSRVLRALGGFEQFLVLRLVGRVVGDPAVGDLAVVVQHEDRAVGDAVEAEVVDIDF